MTHFFKKSVSRNNGVSAVFNEIRFTAHFRAQLCSGLIYVREVSYNTEDKSLELEALGPGTSGSSCAAISHPPACHCPAAVTG